MVHLVSRLVGVWILSLHVDYAATKILHHATCVQYTPYIPHHTYHTTLYCMYNICQIYNDFPATKIPHRDHTTPSLSTLYATIYVVPYPPYKPYKRLHPHTKIPYNAVPCQSLRCHFLDHRMLFNSILFHVNQPWLLTNAFVFIRSFWHNFEMLYF